MEYDVMLLAGAAGLALASGAWRLAMWAGVTRDPDEMSVEEYHRLLAMSPEERRGNK